MTWTARRMPMPIESSPKRGVWDFWAGDSLGDGARQRSSGGDGAAAAAKVIYKITRTTKKVWHYKVWLGARRSESLMVTMAVVAMSSIQIAELCYSSPHCSFSWVGKSTGRFGS